MDSLIQCMDSPVPFILRCGRVEILSSFDILYYYVDTSKSGGGMMESEDGEMLFICGNGVELRVAKEEKVRLATRLSF
jgi:hypothetical protein